MQSTEVKIQEWYTDDTIPLDIRAESFQKYHRNGVHFLYEKYTQIAKSILDADDPNSIINDVCMPVFFHQETGKLSQEEYEKLIHFHKSIVALLIEKIRGVKTSS